MTGYKISDEANPVIQQLTEAVKKWAIPGTQVLQNDWNGSAGSWTIAAYSEEIFDKSHKFISERPNAQLMVLCPTTYAATRDLGLFAMEYPDTYVATAEVSVDDNLLEIDSDSKRGERFFEVLSEAQDFPGPAVIVVVVHDRPFLFRYHPQREQVFIPDSGKMSSLIESFMDREQQTVLFLKKKEVQDQAGKDLAAGLAAASDSITVLFGSDTGHAQECAGQIAKLVKSAGRTVKTMTMNSCQEMPEGLVLFVTATAGKGEFPANATAFAERLMERKEPLPDLKFAVFALGDSKYWPEPEHFAASGRKLHERLVELGASPVLDITIGDDQDADQYRTGLKTWETGLKKALDLKVSEQAAAQDASAAIHKSPEQAKYDSDFLRGTLATSLRDRTTGGIPQPDQVVIKHHGIYQQDDRDMRPERQELGLEPAYSFMARVRLSAGDATAKQWVAMDAIARTLARPNLKITTRQTWQIQGVQKHNLIDSIRRMQVAALDTIAACGDVARNVCCTSNPMACSPALMEEIIDYSRQIHDHCLPKTSAWHEIFILEGPAPHKKYKVGGSTPYEEEPVYGSVYLPRKFKMGVAIPPYNDVDIYTHDVGLIAIIEKDKLAGFNVLIGGGLGFTHNNRKTFPRLGTMLGFVTPEKAKHVAEMVMVVQRDHGDRTDRKHARLKYTVHDHGMDWFRQQVEDLLGYAFEAARPFEFTERSDPLGWMQNEGDKEGRKWHMGLYIEAGRVVGKEMDGLLEIAKLDCCRFRLTCNQSLTLTYIAESKKPMIEAILNEYGIRYKQDLNLGGLRKGAFACASLPMCPLAFAEAERYLPKLVSILEVELEKCGLFSDEIVIRMTGCPNSCGRPEMAEIGLVGVAPGMYKLYLGGCHLGTRANRIHKEGIDEAQIVETLTPLFADYAAHRQQGERFGNFCIRTRVVKENKYGPDFHDF